MLVAFDTNILSLLLHQTARIPLVPGTVNPVTHVRERIDHLLSELSKNRATILIPAPALAEFLVVVEDAGPGYVHTIDKKSAFEVAPFDERAAIEAAQLFRERSTHPEAAKEEEPKQKVKVDLQIVAIARVHAVECLYSADPGLLARAQAAKVPSVALWDLPLPPELAAGHQMTLFEAQQSNPPSAATPEPHGKPSVPAGSESVPPEPDSPPDDSQPPPTAQ